MVERRQPIYRAEPCNCGCECYYVVGPDDRPRQNAFDNGGIVGPEFEARAIAAAMNAEHEDQPKQEEATMPPRE